MKKVATILFYLFLAFNTSFAQDKIKKQKIDSLLKVLQKFVDSTELNTLSMHISKSAGVKASIQTKFSTNEIYEYKVEKVNSINTYSNIFDNDYEVIEKELETQSKNGWELVDIKYIQPFKVSKKSVCCFPEGESEIRIALYIDSVFVQNINDQLIYKHNNKVIKGHLSQEDFNSNVIKNYDKVMGNLNRSASKTIRTILIFKKRKYISDKTLDHLITNINQKIDTELDTKLNNFSLNEIEVIKTTLESFLESGLTSDAKELVKKYLEESIKLYFVNEKAKFKEEIIKEIKATLKP